MGLASMVENFTGFALGVVLVAMLGIGVAERTGLIAAILRQIIHSRRGPSSFRGWSSPAS